MKKAAKIWLAIAFLFIAGGSLLFAVVLGMCEGDFSNLSTEKYTPSTYEIHEDFNMLEIRGTTADVVIVPADEAKVVCYEGEKVNYAVSVEEGVLCITEEDRREYWDFIGIFSYDYPEITVYLPQKTYASLAVEISTGDVGIGKGFSFETAAVSATTGDVEISDLQCGNLSVALTTGDVDLENVIAAQRLSVETTTGDVEFERCDAAEAFFAVRTGDVEGSFLTGKVFDAHTSTGDVKVPASVAGGTCEITTTTGDIRVFIA